MTATLALPQRNDARLGIALMVASCAIFAVQDALSRHLAEAANVYMVVMVRYWFFAAFVVALGRAQAGSVRAAAATSQPLLQTFRGLLLAAVARKLAPGGTLATYSAAGHVRRALTDAGLTVERRPGFGTKRHMTTARVPL